MIVPLAPDFAATMNDSAKFASMVVGGHVLRQYALGQAQSWRETGITVAGAFLGYYLYNAFVRKQVVYVAHQAGGAIADESGMAGSY